jgi:adenylyltransferase/sulfurtransferase
MGPSSWAAGSLIEMNNQTAMLNRARNRYSRQVMFHGIGEEGQEKLCRSRVVIVGCGALGCNIANLLVRAGVGKVRIIDRDFVEYHNLQRQTLFDEEDVELQIPKAVAARRHLQRINSLVEIEGIVADVNFSNVENCCAGYDLILDGLDNLETRYLINDVSLKLSIPYIYGGAISSLGMSMTIIPGQTPCLRCVFPNPPPRMTMPTCETDGVLGTITATMGAMQATEAMKVLTGSQEVSRDLIMLDMWAMSFERVQTVRNPDCPACNGRYDFLEKRDVLIKSSFCGQSRAIQVVDTRCGNFNMIELTEKLKGADNLTCNEHMIRFDAEGLRITVFPDGRAIIGNTLDESQAEKVYLKYVGGGAKSRGFDYS